MDLPRKNEQKSGQFGSTCSSGSMSCCVCWSLMLAFCGADWMALRDAAVADCRLRLEMMVAYSVARLQMAGKGTQ